jgi:hypothetical protein
MKKLLRFRVLFLLLALTLAVFILNARLYAADGQYTFEHVNKDVITQLRFIRAALDNGAGEEMQGLFPEGYFFSHVLYGLAWVEIGLRENESSVLHQQAITEASWALTQLNSPKGRAVFSPSLEPPYGVFYVGWSNWLRGGILKLQSPDKGDPAEVERFIADCEALAEAFDKSASPFLAAYPGQAWPVDSTVAVAALRLHDDLFEPRFEDTITRWLERAQEQLDPMTGLLPHRVNAQTGEPLETARGSSQSVIQRFLPEIDPILAREQYILFRDQFIDTPLGLPGVREYPRGINAEGDVDSGPLILDISLSATVVTVGAARIQGDDKLADTMLDIGEALGLPIEWNGQKRYAFGVLPVGDAFLAWAKTARPWTVDFAPDDFEPVVWAGWRWSVHLVSFGLMALMWLILRRFIITNLKDKFQS